MQAGRRRRSAPCAARQPARWGPPPPPARKTPPPPPPPPPQPPRRPPPPPQKGGGPPRRSRKIAREGGDSATATPQSDLKAEGVGFEPTRDLTAPNGFRDRPARPTSPLPERRATVEGTSEGTKTNSSLR